MKRRLVLLVTSAAAAATIFGMGVGFASGGNYCPNIDTNNCVDLDSPVLDDCCIATQNGHQIATCSRETFWCFNDDGTEGTEFGPAYNCGTPGPSCD